MTKASECQHEFELRRSEFTIEHGDPCNVWTGKWIQVCKKCLKELSSGSSVWTGTVPEWWGKDGRKEERKVSKKS